MQYIEIRRLCNEENTKRMSRNDTAGIVKRKVSDWSSTKQDDGLSSRELFCIRRISEAIPFCENEEIIN